jgi:hypothetical protein
MFCADVVSMTLPAPVSVTSRVAADAEPAPIASAAATATASKAATRVVVRNMVEILAGMRCMDPRSIRAPPLGWTLPGLWRRVVVMFGVGSCGRGR